MTDRTEELMKHLANCGMVKCPTCQWNKGELKGRQEMRDEIREWLLRLSNMGIIDLEHIGFDIMFNIEFGDKK